MMKQKLAVISVIGALAFSGAITVLNTGCASTANWQEDISVTAKLAAYVGASVDIKDNPSRRVVWVASAELLNTLIRDESYDPTKFVAALETLPIKELRSGKGTLVVGTAVILWNRVAARIDIDKVELVKVVMPAVRDGIQQALDASK